MLQLLSRLWTDDAGALVASEYLFLTTILVLGSVVGLAALRNAIATELTELANAILALYTPPGEDPIVLDPPVENPFVFPSVIDVEPCN